MKHYVKKCIQLPEENLAREIRGNDLELIITSYYMCVETTRSNQEHSPKIHSTCVQQNNNHSVFKFKNTFNAHILNVWWDVQLWSDHKTTHNIYTVTQNFSFHRNSNICFMYKRVLMISLHSHNKLKNMSTFIPALLLFKGHFMSWYQYADKILVKFLTTNQ